MLREEPSEPTRLTPTSSTGRGPSPGARAATTAACSSTSRGASPRGSSRGEYERVRDELNERLEALGDDRDGPIGTARHRPEDCMRRRAGSRPTSSSTSATSPGGATGVGTGTVHCSRTTPGRTTRTMHTRGCTCSSRTEFQRGRGRSVRCTTSRPRCSSSSASQCRPRWRGRACSGLPLRASLGRQPLATIPSRTRARSLVRLEGGWWRGVAPGRARGEPPSQAAE